MTGECIEWQGYKNKDGYARRWRPKGKSQFVTRQLLAEQIGRELLPTECVCHTCDNPGCVNLEHLWIGTRGDNMRDMVSKGRGVVPLLRGTKHPMSKLTPEQVNEIRVAIGTQKEIANRYNISQPTVSDIRNGKRYVK